MKWQKARIIKTPDSGVWGDKLVWIYGPPEEVSGTAVSTNGAPVGLLIEKRAFLSNIVHPMHGRLHLDPDRVELLPIFADEGEIVPVLFDDWMNGRESSA